jgi:hypothetical protein
MRYLIFLRLSPKITMTWEMPRIGWLYADRWNIFQLLFLGCQMTIVILHGHCGYTSHRVWSYLYSILYIVRCGCSASGPCEAKKIQKWRDFGGQWFNCFNHSSVQQSVGTVYSGSGVVCNPPFLIKPPPFNCRLLFQECANFDWWLWPTFWLWPITYVFLGNDASARFGS